MNCSFGQRLEYAKGSVWVFGWLALAALRIYVLYVSYLIRRNAKKRLHSLSLAMHGGERFFSKFCFQLERKQRTVSIVRTHACRANMYQPNTTFLVEQPTRKIVDSSSSPPPIRRVFCFFIIPPYSPLTSPLTSSLSRFWLLVVDSCVAMHASIQKASSYYCMLFYVTDYCQAGCIASPR